MLESLDELAPPPEVGFDATAAPLPFEDFVGGLEAPRLGAMGVVVFKRFPADPGMPGFPPALGLRFGSLGLGMAGAGGVILDMSMTSLAPS